ncbi:MAG: hypothetical protein KDA38_10285 [Planctomycetales bacterium]|nr:hypothetical protein [Planctomycetales bacterium]
MARRVLLAQCRDFPGNGVRGSDSPRRAFRGQFASAENSDEHSGDTTAAYRRLVDYPT